MLKLLLLFVLLLIADWGYCQGSRGYSIVKDYPDLLVNPYSAPVSSDSSLIGKSKDSFHPCLFESVSVQKKDSIRKIMLQRLGRDTLNLTELLYCFKPYFDQLVGEDPHFCPLIPWFITKDGTKASDKVALLPWDVININDTIIIERSYDPKFKQGDRILEVNRISVEEFIRYAYVNRYFPFFVCQAFYHYTYSPEYTVKIQRRDEVMNIITSGITYDQYMASSKSKEGKLLLKEYKTGYFPIVNFDNNKKLIKDLAIFIKQMKKEGYSDLILDLRKNEGGTGKRFDELLSLFVEEDTICYLKNVKVRVSEITLKDYDFLTREKMGELVSLPDSYFVKFIPLKREKYQGMNVYVLISENTGSQAATFANILQYNNCAKLAGVPLLHNALKYGEVAYLNWTSNAFAAISMSTVEYDEYTRNPDGQVYPDIEIPFVASEYMKGGDPVLEKLLEYIAWSGLFP